jgi:hypothetical protein
VTAARVRWWLAAAALALGFAAAVDGMLRGTPAAAPTLPAFRPHSGC